MCTWDVGARRGGASTPLALGNAYSLSPQVGEPVGARGCPMGNRNLHATLGIAMVVVGLTISIVAAIAGEGTLRTVVSAAGFLLLTSGVLVLVNARRR
jgi:hypothetical protein